MARKATESVRSLGSNSPPRNLAKAAKGVAALPKVISYLRYSDPSQMTGDTIRRQLALSEGWAKRNNVTIDESLRDEGVSAFRGKNKTEGHLRSILKRIESGHIPTGSFLLIEQLDRLSREDEKKAVHLLCLDPSDVRRLFGSATSRRCVEAAGC